MFDRPNIGMRVLHTLGFGIGTVTAYAERDVVLVKFDQDRPAFAGLPQGLVRVHIVRLEYITPIEELTLLIAKEKIN